MAGVAAQALANSSEEAAFRSDKFWLSSVDDPPVGVQNYRNLMRLSLAITRSRIGIELFPVPDIFVFIVPGRSQYKANATR